MRHLRFVHRWGLVSRLLSFGPLSIALLTWEASPEADVKGYNVYIGTASRQYTQTIDAGNVTQYTITDLAENTPYYFAVTAYDTAGNESDFSNEVSIVFHQHDTTAPEQPVLLSYNYPNPFSPAKEVTHIRYNLRQPAEVTIEIFDMSNALVRTVIRQAARTAGEHTEDIWDGRDDYGRLVANGLYIARIQTPDWTQFIKIAVSR